MIVPESVTFNEARSSTEDLLKQIDGAKLNAEETRKAIASLVKSENGARGFFVTYLTSERTFADHPSPEVIEAMQSSPEIVGELLVKNLAMSAAMAVTHPS